MVKYKEKRKKVTKTIIQIREYKVKKHRIIKINEKSRINKFLPIATLPETIFYTMSVYCMAAKVKKTRYTLAGALLATLAGVVASVFLAGKM